MIMTQDNEFDPSFECILCTCLNGQHLEGCDFLKLEKSPAMREYIIHIAKTADSKAYTVPTPTLALGLKKTFAMMLAMDRIKYKNSTNLNIKQKQDLFDYLTASETIYISPEADQVFMDLNFKVTEAYINSPQKPQPKKLPFNSMCLIPNHPLKFEKGGMTVQMFLALFIVLEGKTLVFSFSFDKENAFVCWPLKDGLEPLTDTMSIMLEERVGKIQEARLPRDVRREIKRVEKKKRIDLNHEEYIKVVTLGTAPKESTHSGDILNLTDRQYYHRWVVRGHLRNQWYPSISGHQLKWIDPHVKGPENAPFVETVRKIVA